MDAVEVDGLRVAYRAAGSGLPVLLLHGGASDGREWRHQLSSLSDTRWVVAWDGPGSGGSEDPPSWWSLSDFARCALGFARAVGLDRPHLVGHSFGAGLALAVLGLAPGFARSLTLVSGYAGWAGSLPPEEVTRRLAACLDAAAHPVEPALEDGRALTGPHPSPELLEELHHLAREARPASYAVAGRAFAEADLRPVLPTVTVPTLVIAGADDRRCPPEVSRALATGIPGATLIVLPGVGHALHQEAPAALAAVLRPFLADAEEVGPRR